MQELKDTVQETPALLVMFGAPDCGVCGVLKPKLAAMLQARFPRMVFRYVDSRAEPDTAAQNSVFTVPTVVVYFAGQEAIRKSRAFSLAALAEEIERPYRLMGL